MVIVTTVDLAILKVKVMGFIEMVITMTRVAMVIMVTTMPGVAPMLVVIWWWVR